MEDVEEFITFIFMYLRRHLKKMTPDTIFCELHRELFLLIQYDRVAGCAPRGFAKSTILSFFYPLYLLCMKKERRIALINSTFNLACVWSSKIRNELKTNLLLINKFGDLLGSDAKKDTDGYFECTNGNVLFSKGYGQTIRGERPTNIIGDDIETDEIVASKEQREKFDAWLTSQVIGTLLPGMQFIWVGTILHPESALAIMINKPLPSWETRFFSAYRDNNIEQGISMWPEMWPHEELVKRRMEMGSTSFAQEFMNDPIPDELRKFKKDQFKYYEELPKGLVYYMAIDPAIKVGDQNDYTAIMVVGVDYHDNWYIAKYVRKRLRPKEIIDHAFELYQRYNAQAIGIEEVGYQEMLYLEMKDQRIDRGLYPVIKPIKTHGIRKQLRIESLQPRYECGKIFHKEGMDELETELLRFPSNRCHDDLIDALSMIMRIARKAKAPTVKKDYETFGDVLARRRAREEDDIIYYGEFNSYD